VGSVSDYKTHQDIVKDKAVTVLRQLASCAVESGEFARLLGMAGEGWIEDTLSRHWRQLADAVENGHLLEKLDSINEEPPF